MIAAAERMLLRRHLVRRGESIVIVAGERLKTGGTNTIRVRTLGARRKSR